MQVNLILTLTLLVATLFKVSKARSVVFDPNPLAEFNINSIYNSNTYFSSISQDNQYAFVASGANGVYILSIANKMNPYVVGNIKSQSAVFTTFLNGVLYIADQLEGLLIYDMSDIINPVLLYNWQLYKRVQSVAITSDSQFAFALGNGIIYVIYLKDIKNPQTIDYTGVIAPESYRVKLSNDQTHICVSNHIQGIQIYDVRIKNKIQIRASQNPVFVVWDCIFTPDHSAVFVVDAYYGLFYANVQAIFGTAQGSTTTYPLTFKSIYVTPQIQQSVALTSDGLFLILGLRSIGLILFEIQSSNYQAPVFVQRLNGNYLADDVYFSNNDNEMYAFVTNGMSLLIFKQAQINTNKDFPNIFNTFQSSLTYVSPNQFPWQIICLKKSEYMIEANNSNGAGFYDISNPYYPKLVTMLATRNGNFGGLATNQAENILFLPASQDGLEFYDISTFSVPDYKKNYTPLDPTKYKNQGVGVSLDSSGNILIVSNGFYGFGVLDVSDPLNYKQIGLYVNTQYPCGFEYCLITSDLKTIICACREVGLFFYDFTNYKLNLIHVLEILGSEYLILSKNEQFAFVCNGFQGILIVNIQNKSTPKIIGSQPLDGWAQSVISLLNEKYLLVSQIEKGQLVVVNIENFASPYIQSKLSYPKESSQSLCLTIDGKTALSIGNKGLRSLPIQTDLIVHTQIQVQLTDTNGKSYFSDLNIGDNLLVGQTAQVFFIPLYISQDVKFNNVYYYRNFQIQTLPGWITFYQQTNSLQIQVDKSGALNTFSKDASGENIIILDCFISLSSTNFVTQNINSPLATQVYTTLVNQGYLDTEGFLTSLLDPTIEFYLNFFDNNQFTQSNVGTAAQIQLIQQDIKQILVFSRVSYPARFFIKSSLFFNYQNRTPSTLQNLIVSPSLQVSILLQIQQNGIFVKKNFDGVLTTFSDDLTSVKLQGQTFYVNQIVSNSILVANKTSYLENVIVDVILSDSSNYDISLTIPLSNLTFFSLYKPLQKNTINSLQTQFNKQFASGNLQVEQRFQFSFDMGSFVESENLTLSYTAYIVESPTNLIQITSGNWIEFNSFNLGFSGSKSIGSLMDSYTIRLVATDGYSTMYDEFTFEFTQIPFTYIFQMIIQIVGPLVGILGIWKYRAEIYLFLMNKQYKYSNETAVVGSMYRKQIVLMDEMWEATVRLWKKFIQQNREFGKELLAEYNQNQKIDIPVIMGQLLSVYYDHQKSFFQIDPREFEFLDSRLVRLVKRFCFQIILMKDKNTQQALRLLKLKGSKDNTRKDWYKSYIDINYKFEIEENQVVRYQSSNQQINFTNFGPDSKNQTGLNQINSDPAKNNSVNQQNNKDLNNSPVQEYIKDIENKDENQFKLTERNNEQNEGKADEVEGKDNVEQMIPSLIQPQDLDFSYVSKEYPANSITSTNQIQLVFKKSPIIQPTQEKSKQFMKLDKEEIFNLNPFPQMQLRLKEIHDALEPKKTGLTWDNNLLAEMLFLEASGIGFSSPSRMKPANGESVHLRSHQLLRVEAFKRDEQDSCCLCLKTFFRADYSPIGLNENNPLPSWLNCQIIDNIIHLWGTPRSNDEPEIQIRVIDQLTFTVLSYNIEIRDKQGNYLKDKNNESQIQKIRSENNIVSSMRMLKQSQNSPLSQNYDSNIDQQIKTLSAIPKLSKFCNEMSNQQQRMRGLSLQPISSRIPAIAEANLKNEQGTPPFKQEIDFLKELNHKKIMSSEKKRENGVIKESPTELEMAESKQADEENQSMTKSSELDENCQQEQNKIQTITVTNYIKNLK